MFRRLVTQIMVLSMLRSFGKIGPQIYQIWAWLSRGHRWSPVVRNPLKSSVTGPSLLVNCYLEIKFHKIIRVNPPPLKSSKFVHVQNFCARNAHISHQIKFFVSSPSMYKQMGLCLAQYHFKVEENREKINFQLLN